MVNVPLTRVPRTMKAALAMAVLGCASGNAWAQYSPSHERVPFRYERSVAAPITSYFKPLAIGAMLSAWSLRYDLASNSRFARGFWETDLVDVGDAYGNGGYLSAMGAGFWGLGTALGDTAMRHTGQAVLTGMLLDGICVTSLKLATQRERPDGSDRRSFPSGHTSGAWTVSTILARRHGPIVGVPAYTLASLTAVARMEDSRHYLSDVIAGATIGFVIGRIVTRHHTEAGLPLSAQFDGRRASFGLAF